VEIADIVWSETACRSTTATSPPASFLVHGCRLDILSDELSDALFAALAFLAAAIFGIYAARYPMADHYREPE
jgi:hypothetical protein